ncbi:unnamed protein product [Protopolystoma xenopodis]|uniref:Uncharacterized protein n=1 Tax=Protopolystoma xenopodis TaxID=117903 RepID=A0A3S5B4N3_9PLAT|nr:unnamed protein product [Protopolystoma xenopodis]
MLPWYDDVLYMTDESSAFFSGIEGDYLGNSVTMNVSVKLVKRNPPSSSDGLDLRNSSPNTFTRNGSKLDDIVDIE